MATTLTKNNAIKSHILLGNIFDANTINKLVGLFNNGTIAKYVEDERAINNLND